MSLVYIVEDDINMQEIETYALKDSGYTVEAFGCAKDFYRSISLKVPDLVLLDITLPDDNGFDILKKLRESPETKNISIIIITAKSEEADKVKGLELGADDYITKPFGILEFLVRVKAVLRRTHNMQEEKILEVNNIYLDSEKNIVYNNGNLCKLTFIEYNILKLLMVNNKIVVSKTDMIEQIWGTNFNCKPRTLNLHMNTLRIKLGDTGSKIKTVRHVGYILE